LNSRYRERETTAPYPRMVDGIPRAWRFQLLQISVRYPYQQLGKSGGKGRKGTWGLCELGDLQLQSRTSVELLRINPERRLSEFQAEL